MYLGEEPAYALVVSTVPNKEIAANEGAISGSATEGTLSGSASEDAISGSSSEGAISGSGEDSEASSDFQDAASDFEEKEELVGNDSLPDHVPNVDYDKEDPPMEVGSTYPNMKEFKFALAQHAIKHEFEYSREKSDPTRYRALCARKRDDKCPWRLHASTMGDRVTIKVKKNPAAHECTSRRRTKKVKNASKFWVCEKVKDWLIEDATLGAKELQRRLKDDHKVKVHYKRVYMGKQLALNQLYGNWDSSFDNLAMGSGKATGKSKGKAKNVNPVVLHDSPATGTRNATRSKRRLSL